MRAGILDGSEGWKESGRKEVMVLWGRFVRCACITAALKMGRGVCAGPGKMLTGRWCAQIMGRPLPWRWTP